jgi:ribosomal silencing factor RsfS
MPERDPEKMVLATAKAMALADIGAGTTRVVREYVVDARSVLIDVLKSAKRQRWELDELLTALVPRKIKTKK